MFKESGFILDFEYFIVRKAGAIVCSTTAMLKLTTMPCGVTKKLALAKTLKISREKAKWKK